ncbi:MAG: ABC transporter permease [Pseudomonadota bacterium]
MTHLMHLTRLESLAFLRSKSALFWTFAYPVVLLVLLNALFSQSATKLNVEIDDLSRGQASIVKDALIERVSFIEGLEFAFDDVDNEAPIRGGTVRLTFDETFSEAGGNVTIGFKPPVSAETGSTIAMVSEALEYMNRTAVTADPNWTLAYDVTEGAATGGQASTRFLITGLAALTIITTALFGFTGVIIQLRDAGALRPFQIMPVKRRDYILAFSASRGVILLVFSLIFIIGANLIYRAGIDLSLGTLALALVTSAAGIFAFLGIGLAIAAFITKPATGQAVINTLNLPVIFLSDLFIPVSAMPEWIQSIVSVSPIYAFVNLLRNIFDGRSFGAADVQTLVMLFALGTLAFWIAMSSFKWRPAK